MKEEKKLPKLIVILGSTACGKTSWSIELAKKYHGEIISTDSRQIYKKMDIGTAKEPGEWRRNGLRKTYYIDDIPHHLIDFLDPGKHFTVAEFRDKALKYCKMAYKNNRVPIIAGGTGLYIQSIVDNYRIPRVPPNKKLRQSLEEKTNQELMKLLEKMDQGAAKKIDRENKRRVIRALEVCILSGETFSKLREKGEPLFEILQIGIKVPKEVLDRRIDDRVEEMMKMGLLKEVEALRRQKYGWHLPSMSGIGYRQFKPYFEGKISLDEAIKTLKRDTRRYARRQAAWFKRDDRIIWCETLQQADELVSNFLNK